MEPFKALWHLTFDGFDELDLVFRVEKQLGVKILAEALVVPKGKLLLRRSFGEFAENAIPSSMALIAHPPAA